MDNDSIVSFIVSRNWNVWLYFKINHVFRTVLDLQRNHENSTESFHIPHTYFLIIKFYITINICYNEYTDNHTLLLIRIHVFFFFNISSFSPRSFFCSRITSRIQLFIMSPWAPPGCDSCSDSPCFGWLDGSVGQVFGRISFHWNFMFFSLIRLGLGVFGRKSTGLECHFHHIMSRVHTINVTYHGWCWPWSPGWGVSARFLHCRVTAILPPSILSFLAESHYIQSILKRYYLFVFGFVRVLTFCHHKMLQALLEYFLLQS